MAENSILKRERSDVSGRRDRGEQDSAGDGRFLGGLVRSVQDAHADDRGNRAGEYGETDGRQAECGRQMNIPSKFNIRSIPTLLVFKGGQVADQIVGKVPKDTIDKVIQRHITS